MTAAEKNAARREIEQDLEDSLLGSPGWEKHIKALSKFDRDHPNLFEDDHELLNR